MILDNLEKAIGQPYTKRSKLAKKLIGNRIVDALLFMPSYSVLKKYVYPATFLDKNQTIVTKYIPMAIEKNRYRGSRKPIKVFGLSGDTPIELVFFNSRSAYFLNYLEIGREIVVCGKLEESMTGQLQIIHPESVAGPEKLAEISGVHNVYSLTAGVSSYMVQSIIKTSISLMERENFSEWIPEDILKKYGWTSFVNSIKKVHKPILSDDTTLKSVYRQRICFDECLAEQIAKKINNDKNSKQGCIIKNNQVLFNKLISKLPFKLTEEQKRVLQEIESDISSGNSMFRLLQGDVGSGKTIVALLSAMLVIESGYQVAFLAPTEILARQHYELFKSILDDIGILVTILTSNEKGKKRTAINQSIFDGSSKIVVGTHAIISESVVFNSLGLVIIDEQHRFGVNQRLQLINKGISPHVLSMTATPIPRTLILSAYSNISVSSIKQKPHDRRDIITRAIPLSRMSEIIDSMKNTILRREKIYWVCPLIEENEKLDYTCVMSRYAYLEKIFGNDVLVMHGKMKTDERQEIFEKFKTGEAHILVSTTIIEVGVDIKDASVIIIENAEKFGLSQLHQLRGRVGRSSIQSYCLLLYDIKINSLQRERLQVIRESSDGFYIADRDLMLRGGGEIFGTKQSGLKKYKTFDVADEENKWIIYKIMKEAACLAQTIDISSCETLLRIFLPENFETINKSF